MNSQVAQKKFFETVILTKKGIAFGSVNPRRGRGIGSIAIFSLELTYVNRQAIQLIF